jgi:F0F1-type ATP synthase assembly protein I
MASEQQEPEPSRKPGKMSGWMSAATYASIGIEMGLSVVIGYLIGSWLDGRYGTEPWLTLFFLLCGVAAAFRAVFRVGRAARRAMAEQDDERGD